jgi:hypothetical protein
MGKMTKKGRDFVSDEISHLMKEGPSKGPQKGKKMPQKQAVAVALDVARRKGLKDGKKNEQSLDRLPLNLDETGPYKRAAVSYKLARRGGAPVGNALGHGLLGMAGGADPGKKPGPLGHMTSYLRNRRREMGWNKPQSGSSPPPQSPKPALSAPRPPQEPHYSMSSESESTMSIFDNIVAESKLTATARKHIKKSNFALPKERSKTHGKGGYPIHDIEHARNALSRVSTFGSEAEKKAVRAKVYAKYPGLKKRHDERESKDESISLFDGIIAERELPEAFKKNMGRFTSKKDEGPEHEAAESPEEERREHESGEEAQDESTSIFDAIIESKAKSVFDDIVESADRKVDWDDRIARTSLLSEELINIRNATVN